jgi:hypothetical protein
MKLLPEKYVRVPIVAWATATRRTYRLDGNIRRPVVTVESIGIEAMPCNDYMCSEIEVDRDEPEPVVTVTPAVANTFKIMKEDEQGSLHDFCYEINGAFTDINFDESLKHCMEMD